VIKDPNGDLIAGVRVSIENGQNPKVETMTDERGRFRFDAVAPGAYSLKATAAGFALHEQSVRVGSEPSGRDLLITLKPTISEIVTVNDGAFTVTIDPQNAAGSQVLREKDLKALPDDPDQLSEQLKVLATSSGSAPGQAITTVDGFTIDGRLPPKSAIREVRINPDLFSAEYEKAPYQGGRIQIYTRPGSLDFNGAAFFNYNNSVLNARDAFSSRRAPANTERYGFDFGGPIIKKRMGFLSDFESRHINESTTVNALVLDANGSPNSFVVNVPAPKRVLIGSARFDFQIDPTNTFIARYDYSSDRFEGQGAGGFNLPDRSYNSNVTSNSLKLSDNIVINANAYNETRFALSRLRISQDAISREQATVVFGAFSSGGNAVQSQRREEWLLEIADTLSIIKGRHSLKLGLQAFGKYIDDLRPDNFNGTYIFGGAIAPRLDENGQIITGPDGAVVESISGLEQYRRTLLGLPGGRPTRFTINRGNPKVRANQWQVAGFIQDEWRLRTNLSASLGLRYEGQTNIGDKLSLAPRAGIAYAPDKKRQWVLRARAGVFYDRISESLFIEAARFNGTRIEQILIDSPSFPDPFIGDIENRAINTIRVLSDDLRPPTSLQMQFSLERQLPRGWKIQTSHSWSYGWFALRSRNINAPLIGEGENPALAPRPLDTSDNVLQFESEGVVSGRVLFVGANQASNKYFNLYSGYLFFDFQSNADNSLMLPQSSYTEAGERARPLWQTRHRIFVVGILNLPLKLRASVSLNAASGTPFNVTTGRDNNGDGNFNDRPSLVGGDFPGAVVTDLGAFDASGVNGTLPRNWGTNPHTKTVDLNISRVFSINNVAAGNQSGDSRTYRLTVNVRASNLFNHTNVVGINGVVTSPFFGRANVSLPPRRIEAGLRFSF
jgi:hypothetical protein